MSGNKILLESGTNEVEFIEFILEGQSFGINVSKVREIIPYQPDAISQVPEAYHSVKGMFILRDSSMPLIDLKKHMEIKEKDATDAHKVILVCEFNDLVNGFLVDGISLIHRCSWADIKPLATYISKFRPNITSTITIKGKNILLLDLEHVLSDVYPSTRMIYGGEDKYEPAEEITRHHSRENVRIIFAEDSPIVRARTEQVLKECGYENLTIYDNGLSAYDHVVELVEKAAGEDKPPLHYLDVVVTDVEMPQMDGLTLCRKLKEDHGLRELPVIIFSSLINEKMILKCKSVGANSWANKLKIEELIEMLDSYCLENQGP